MVLTRLEGRLGLAGRMQMLSLRGGTFGGISRESGGFVEGVKVRVPPFTVLPLNDEYITHFGGKKINKYTI